MVGATQVIIDGARNSHNGEVKLAGKLPGAAQRAVTSDDYQRVDAVFLDVVIGLLTALDSLELLAARRLEDGASVMDDVGNVLGLEFHDLVFNQTLIATVNAFYLKAVVDSRTGDRTDCRIHAWSITARGQYADCLDFCHN